MRPSLGLNHRDLDPSGESVDFSVGSTTHGPGFFCEFHDIQWWWWDYMAVAHDHVHSALTFFGRIEVDIWNLQTKYVGYLDVNAKL